MPAFPMPSGLTLPMGADDSRGAGLTVPCALTLMPRKEERSRQMRTGFDAELQDRLMRYAAIGSQSDEDYGSD